MGRFNQTWANEDSRENEVAARREHKQWLKDMNDVIQEMKQQPVEDFNIDLENIGVSDSGPTEEIPF